jgi:Arc/MetJ-type ribon-helix-helix transcriptional regulator
MDRYLAQCADDAFKILAGDGDWHSRVSDARARLLTSDAAYENASDAIKDAISEVKSAPANLPDTSNALRRAITTILSEFDRQGA